MGARDPLSPARVAIIRTEMGARGIVVVIVFVFVVVVVVVFAVIVDRASAAVMRRRISSHAVARSRRRSRRGEVWRSLSATTVTFDG
jgi:hypothetical protein